MREKYLKISSLAKRVLGVIDNIRKHKIDNVEDELSVIYQNYCDIVGGHSNGKNIAAILYDLSENFTNYCSRESGNDDSDVDDNYDEVIEQLQSIEKELSKEAKDLADSNGILPEDESMILSAKTGRLRIQVDDNFEGYACEQEAEGKVWCRANEVESRFLDPARNKSSTMKELSNLFLLNRTTTELPAAIATDAVPGRSIITAEIHAVEKSLVNANPENLTTCEGIAEELGWNKKKGKDWNREKVRRGHTGRKENPKCIVINTQYQPVPNSLGNVHVKGIGRYGEGKAGILSVINQTTGEEKKKEKAFAKLLIKFVRNGKGFTEESLKKAELYLENKITDKNTQIERLNRLGYLCCFKEVTRRKHQGFIKNESGEYEKIAELPFGIIGALTLKLLSGGYLRMSQVFDEDSEYGVFTGKEIMHVDNFEATKNKFEAVLKLYCDSYKSKRYKLSDLGDDFINGCTIPFTEHFHQLMLKIYGGKDDSSGEEYSSADEDTQELTGKESHRLRM